MCIRDSSKTEFKGKHSQKLPEELIHAVVSLLLVLTDLCDVIIQIFLAEYLLCNNYLLKSKFSRQSVKQYCIDSPLKNVIFSTYNWILGPLHTENRTFKEVCRKQTVLCIDFKFWILVGNYYIMYRLFGEFWSVLPLKFIFRMIFQRYPASLGQFGACDVFFQLAFLL